MPETYEAWCQALGVTHAHCIYDCEHPQPFILLPGVLVCGRCWFICGERTEMVPCTPEVCD